MNEDRCELLCLDSVRAEDIRRALVEEEITQRAADRARALSDPTRLMFAVALREGGELCVCDLAWICGRSQNLVSHHMRLLKTSRLARSRRDGKLVMYELTKEGNSLLEAILGERNEPVRAGAQEPRTGS